MLESCPVVETLSVWRLYLPLLQHFIPFSFYHCLSQPLLSRFLSLAPGGHRLQFPLLSLRMFHIISLLLTMTTI